MAIAGEGRPAVFFEPTDMPANLSKRFPKPLLVGFAWKKAGNLYVHAASAVTERIGVNRLVDQGEEMSFGCGELFHWKSPEIRFAWWWVSLSIMNKKWIAYIQKMNNAYRTR
jgi:hypothetical protein